MVEPAQNPVRDVVRLTGSDERTSNVASVFSVVTAALVVLWACYSLNGFRGWWVPITLSDDNSGAAIRQALFAGSAALSVGILWVRGVAWDTVRSQWRLMVLAGWLVASVLYSDLPSITLKRAILFVCGTITAVTFVAVARDPLRRVARLLVGITGGAAWMSIVWMVALSPAITTNPARPGLAGISNHPNTLAPALAIGLVLALGTPLRGKTGLAWRVAAALGCAVALGLTTSVTSIGLGLIATALYFALRLPAYWKTLATLIVIGVGVLVSLWGVDQIAADLLGSIGRDTSMSGRGDLWGIVWSEAQKAPVFGNGWGAFWTEGKGRDLVGTWNPRQSHNAYLDVVLDIGFIGLSLFGLLLVPVLWKLSKTIAGHTDPEKKSIAAAMLAAMLGLLTVYGLQQSFLGKVDAFAFSCVLLISAAALERREPPPELATRPNETRGQNYATESRPSS